MRIRRLKLAYFRSVAEGEVIFPGHTANILAELNWTVPYGLIRQPPHGRGRTGGHAVSVMGDHPEAADDGFRDGRPFPRAGKSSPRDRCRASDTNSPGDMEPSPCMLWISHFHHTGGTAPYSGQPSKKGPFQGKNRSTAEFCKRLSGKVRPILRGCGSRMASCRFRNGPEPSDMFRAGSGDCPRSGGVRENPGRGPRSFAATEPAAVPGPQPRRWLEAPIRQRQPAGGADRARRMIRERKIRGSKG